MQSKLWLLIVFESFLCFLAATEIDTTAPFVAQLYVPEIIRPRALLLDDAGDILVTSATESRITAIRETNHGNGTSTVETKVILEGTGLGLTHGIAFHNGFLYASAASTVFRWPYKPGQFRLINPNWRQIVISNIPDELPSFHNVRSMVFDDVGRLYVGVGSQNNVDNDSSRSRIRRFNLAQQFLPIPFSNGETFADGCRNSLGLAFSPKGTLFTVDNAGDWIDRPDLDVIWGQNPGEEMNKMLISGANYGYPYCWSIYNHDVFPQNTQFAWRDFLENGTHTDEWCQDPVNNEPPVLVMPAHSAPISLQFYNGVGCGINGGFPCRATGDAIVTFRGSFHPGANTGYKTSWYIFDRDLELPTGEVIDVIFAPNAASGCQDCLRPVGAAFNNDGHLIVTGEVTNEIFRVAYDIALPSIQNIYH